MFDRTKYFLQCIWKSLLHLEGESSFNSLCNTIWRFDLYYIYFNIWFNSYLILMSVKGTTIYTKRFKKWIVVVVGVDLFQIVFRIISHSRSQLPVIFG